jgi:hypothetical protein
VVGRVVPAFALVKWVLVEVRLGLLVISVVVGIGRWVKRRGEKES